MQKTCRDLGHFKKYSEKVANDPIWLTYNRAYKQHYARLLKKKMTQAEFQAWADYATFITTSEKNSFPSWWK